MDSNILASWLAFLSTILLFVAIDLGKEGDSSYIKSLAGIKEENLWKRLARTLGPIVVPLFPVANMKRLEQKLTWAGNPWGISGDIFVGIKVIALLGGLVTGSLLASLGMFPALMMLLPILAYFIPDIILSGEVEKRQKKIYREMPMMVGLLATAVRAGMELGPALEVVGTNTPGPLGDELRRAWREIATGRSRSASLRAMAKRTGVKTVERFVDTIVTAEERGSERISDTLAAYMHDLRESQMRQIQEQARKLPTKMLLPLFLCIFVPLLAILVVPVVFQMKEVF